MTQSHSQHTQRERQTGQAMIEYALILALFILAFGFALAATGPAIGNVFRDQVYNVIGVDDLADVVDLPDAEEFWLTVTWVAQNTPVTAPLPTRTLPPPSQAPPSGNTATPTFTPTETPTIPTNTPAPTETPPDQIYPYPFEDSANPDQIKRWRLDDSYFLSAEDWYGLYYANRELAGTPAEQFYNYEIDDSHRYEIDFNWGNGSPIAGWVEDEFSISWRRIINLSEPTTLTFDVPQLSGDGMRVWIVGGAFGGDATLTGNGPGTCSSTGVTPGGLGPEQGGSWDVYDDDHFGYDPATDPTGANAPTDCLILDRWRHSDWWTPEVFGVERTVPAGQYMIQVDYYEMNNNAEINLNLSVKGHRVNPDDTRIDNSGNPVDGRPACGYWNHEANRSDTLGFYYNEYSGSDLPEGSRCYMELRGAIAVPSGAVNPTLSFWSAWDFGSGTSAWVEVAEYARDGSNNFDRSLVTWDRIPLHNGGEYNYNWTYQSIDVSAYAGKEMIVRFGMENTNGNGDSKWFVDTIRVEDTSYPDLYTAREWTLDSPLDLDDFILSGSWELTTENALGGSGTALHESPGRRAYDMDANNDNNNTAYEEYRAHAVEFKGMIDLDNANGLVDNEGDYGKPIVSFWHQYDLGKKVGIYVQYTHDPYGTPNPTWVTVPDGEFQDRTRDSGIEVTLPELVELPLDTIPDNANGDPRFRLRLVMLMHRNSGNTDGWWIDNIKLERLGNPQFLDYPFTDDGESQNFMEDEYLIGGSWASVDGGRMPNFPDPGGAYHDSPQGDWVKDSQSSLEFRGILDLFLDTEDNAKSPACNLGADCETPGVAPVDPVMSFWHRRDFNFNGGADFYVEWKYAEEKTWNVLWLYEDQMQTNGSGDRKATRVQKAWERVFVDLRPIWEEVNANDDPGDFRDDDINLRFRLKTNSSNNLGDGIWIDDIRIADREAEDVFHFWDAGVQGTDSGGTPLFDPDGSASIGDGLFYYDGLDNNPDLFNGDWTFGGEWTGVTWEQNTGLLAFHDSPELQIYTPGDKISTPPDPDEYVEVTDFATKNDTFNVLEMNTIIDLRGTNAVDNPVMYFWHRYAIGSGDYAQVQISHEVGTPSHNCRVNGIEQCYDKVYGWSEWENVRLPNTDSDVNPDNGIYNKDRNYLWTRMQVDLRQYAKTTSRDGQRIRVRFLVDALSNDSNWDGWYIDDISFEYYLPRTVTIDRNIAGGTFFDPARNMSNWIPEGTWGLSPNFFRGSGGGVVSLGPNPWHYELWDLESCTSNQTLSEVARCAEDELEPFADVPDPTLGLPMTGFVPEINFDWGSKGPNEIRNRGGGERDEFAARYQLTTPEVGAGLGIDAGTFIFIVTSDDAVRLRYDTIPAGNLPPINDPANFPLAGQFWNIINNWTPHGRTVDMGAARLEAGKEYRFTLEYYEGYDDAALMMSTGANTMSFTDSPASGPDIATQGVPAKQRSYSSLIFDGEFDLTNTVAPILQYYTYHELGGTAFVEVSTNGGFDWESAPLLGGVELDSTIWDAAPWQAELFDGRNLDWDPAIGAPNPGITPDHVIEFADLTPNIPWGGGAYGGPLGNAWLKENFSIRFTRDLTLTQATDVTFIVRGDDGYRLWINYFEGCQTVDNNGNTSVIVSGQPQTGNNRTFSSPFSCLAIDDWRDQAPYTNTVTRTLPAGTHTIQLDYYENSGGAEISLNTVSAGFDDPQYNGTEMPNKGDWVFKQHDLSAYIGQTINLRFRLDRTSKKGPEEGGDFQSNNQPDPFNWFESWWVVDVTVIDP